MTPATNGELIIASFYQPPGSTYNTMTIDSGFTILGQNTTTNEGAASAYLVQGTAGAIAPTWSNVGPGSGYPGLGVSAAFKPGSSPPLATGKFLFGGTP
jgi:hypothetical protein